MLQNPSGTRTISDNPAVSKHYLQALSNQRSNWRKFVKSPQQQINAKSQRNRAIRPAQWRCERICHFAISSVCVFYCPSQKKNRSIFSIFIGKAPVQPNASAESPFKFRSLDTWHYFINIQTHGQIELALWRMFCISNLSTLSMPSSCTFAWLLRRTWALLPLRMLELPFYARGFSRAVFSPVLVRIWFSNLFAFRKLSTNSNRNVSDKLDDFFYCNENMKLFRKS